MEYKGLQQGPRKRRPPLNELGPEKNSNSSITTTLQRRWRILLTLIHTSATTTSTCETSQAQKGQSARSRDGVLDGDSTGLVVRVGCAINVVVGLEEDASRDCDPDKFEFRKDVIPFNATVVGVALPTIQADLSMTTATSSTKANFKSRKLPVNQKLSSHWTARCTRDTDPIFRGVQEDRRYR